MPTNEISAITVTCSEDLVIPGYPAQSLSVIVTGGTASPVLFVSAATATELSFTVTPTGQGMITVSIPAGTATDRNSIANNQPSNTISMIYDSIRPALRLTIEAAFYARNATLTDVAGVAVRSWEARLIVSEIPRLVTQAMIVPVNAQAVPGTFVRRADLDAEYAVGSNVYSFRLRPLVDGPVTLTLAANTFKDLANNLNTGNITSAVFDTQRPVPNLRPVHPPVSNFTTAYFLLDLEEEVQFLRISDFTVLNGVAHSLVRLNTTAGLWLGQTRARYEFYVDPVAEGVVSVQLLAGSLLDLAGNPCVASVNNTFLFDNSRPVPRLTTLTRNITNTVEVFTLAFSEVPFGLTNASFLCLNCTISRVVRLGAAPPTNQTSVFAANPRVVYNITVLPSVLEGGVEVMLPLAAVEDRGKNGNVPSDRVVFYWDSIRPTALIETETPLNANQHNLQHATVYLSEPVVAFTPAHVFARRCDVVSVERHENITNAFVLQLEPWLPGPAILTDVRIQIAEDALRDPAGNGNVQSFKVDSNSTSREIRFLYHTLPPPKFNYVPIVMFITGLVSVFLVPIVYVNYLRRRVRWEVSRGIYRDAVLTLDASTAERTKALRTNLLFLKQYPRPYLHKPPQPSASLNGDTVPLVGAVDSPNAGTDTAVGVGVPAVKTKRKTGTGRASGTSGGSGKSSKKGGAPVAKSRQRGAKTATADAVP